ncbi:peptidase S9 prolyl oligopeptidase active site domain protein [Hysterangium stoloniferum]|nr:peptidase S9 prolyl oligopeptidase active site domain protein [Hysterangium stoloniferum]
MAFTIENIASAVKLGGVVLSPDGSKLVYDVGPGLKSGEHATSALWYSKDLTKADGAKQLTSGLFNDRGAQWHPNSESIFFLSDRHKQGGPSQIYKYSMDGPGEPALLNDAFKEKKCEEISPNGNYIAFRSADEPTAEEEEKEKEKDDAKVFGEKKGFVRLRLYTVSTGQVRTLVDDQNVETITWSPDSKSLAYMASVRPDFEGLDYEPTSFHTISILPTVTESRRIKEFKNSLILRTIWISDEYSEVYTLQPFDPTQLIDATAVHRLSLDTSSGDASNKHFYAGETEDAAGITNIGSNDEFSVPIAAGVNTRVDILNRDGKVFTLVDAKNRWGFSAYDVKKVGNDYVVACVRSSGPDNETPNVWVGKSTGKHMVRFCVDLNTKVSSHYDWLKEHKLGPVEIFEWTGTDGVQLNGFAWFPPNVDPSNIKKPLPTILYIHGGPYYRDTPKFELGIYDGGWTALLAERGYLVLTPNYRGSSGRGSVFARAAYHGMGTIEWSDVDGMVDEAVKRGLADKDKLAIGGWSQGGFLTAWGVSQTKYKYKCGIMGAGVSDWGKMAIESDLPGFENELGSAAPWLGADARLAGDPIRHIKDIETAVLILHGEKDVRVPVSQGIGFHRGLRRMSKFPERHTLVVYPREGHGFEERKHGEDLLRRIIAHYDAWLK